jgi:hypothetical protein
MSKKFNNLSNSNLDINRKMKISSGEIFLGDNGKRTTLTSNSPSSNITLTLPSETGNILSSNGRILETMTESNMDDVGGTFTTDMILGGILIHTTNTTDGELITESGANIINNCNLTEDNMCISCYVINDGDQNDFIVGNVNVTIIDG